MNWNPDFTLRDYQKEACADTRSGWMETNPKTGAGPFQRLLLLAATGAGKTIMAAALKYWMAKVIGAKTLFLADSDELCDQAKGKVFQTTGELCTLEKADQNADLNSQFTVGSIQSIGIPRRLKRFPKNHFGLVIADEAHLSMSAGWQRTLNHFGEGGSNILGITATPDRHDKKSLMDFYEHISAEIDLFFLINLGFLAPITVDTIPLKIEVSDADIDAEEQEEVAKAVEPYYAEIIKEWRERAGERKTLFFLPTIASSKMFTKMLRERGITSEHIDGYSKDRKEILARYSRGETHTLTNAQLLIKGYDEPSIECIVNLRTTRRRGTFVQLVGRGTRLHPGKTDLLLLDFLWQYENLEPVKVADLITEDEATAEAITKRLQQGDKQMNLQAIKDEVFGEREQATIKEMRQKRRMKARTFDIREWSAVMKKPEIETYQPNAKWEREPVSPKQRELLERNRIDPDEVGGRGQASAIISEIIERREAGLGSVKQVSFATDLNIEGAATMTFEEIGAAIEQKLKN